MNFSTIVISLFSLGIPLGVMKFIAEYHKDNHSEVMKIYENCAKLIILASITGLILIGFFSKYLSLFLLNQTNYQQYIILIGSFLPFSILVLFWDSYLKGLKAINLVVMLSIITMIINILFLIPFVIEFNIEGALIASIVGPVISFGIYYVILKRKHLLLKLNIKNKLDFQIIFKILKIGIAFLIVSFSQLFAVLIIRKITIDNFNVYGNGIYQSVLMISLNYFGFIFVTLSSYSVPKISEMKTNVEIVNEMNVNLRFILFLMVPMICLVIVFRQFIIVMLFTRDFMPGDKLYIYQTLGELLRAVSWVFALWYVPKLHLKAFVFFDLLLNFNYIFIYIILLKLLPSSLVYVSVSYMAAYFIHVILNFLYSKYKIKFSITGNNIKLICISIVTVLLILVLSINGNFAYYLVLPFLLIWLYLSMDRQEVISIKDSFKDLIK